MKKINKYFLSIIIAFFIVISIGINKSNNSFAENWWDYPKQEYNDLFANPYEAARYGYIDDVIEPRNTRFRIIRALQNTVTKKLQNPPKKHDNLPL